MPVKIAWSSCQIPARSNNGFRRVVDSGAKTFVHLGDALYSSTAYGQEWGGANVTEGSGTDPSAANFTEMQLQSVSTPGMKYLIDNTDFYYMPDDHEYTGDNWDHSITKAEAGPDPMISPSQAEVDAAFKAAWDGVDAHYTWPTNTDTDAVAEKPIASDEATAVNYPPRYYRFTKGNMECFVIDCISHRDPAKASDRTGYGVAGDPTMLGTQQKLWLKNQLKASPAKFKIIFSGKKTFSTLTADNADMWDVTPQDAVNYPGYIAERDEILAYIHAATDWAVPGGVVWCAGDRHTPEVSATYTAGRTEPDTAATAAYDHVCVTACPVGTGINSTLGTLNTHTILLEPDFRQVFGMIEDKDSYVEITLNSIISGNTLWRGRVNAGENKLHYPEIQVSI